MDDSRKDLMECIDQMIRQLPSHHLTQVLHFVSALAETEDPQAGSRAGNPAAILTALEGFRFEPGEIDRLMSEIQESRGSDGCRVAHPDAQ